MANTFFKSFAESDRTSSRTLLHEAIPITGTLVSGTYSANSNIKTFSHGMFQSVYDYPYASSSANHIFDVTYGYHASSSFFGASNTQHSKKSNIYSQMAQVLSGFDTDSKIRRFDQDGDFAAGGPKYDEAFVVTFSRLLTKDEIKKGSFSMTLGTGSTYAAPFASGSTITDTGAATSYNVNSPAGEYGILKDASSNSVGLLYYQAGIAILSSSVLGPVPTTQMDAAGQFHGALATGSNIDALGNAFLHRVQNIQFNNTTELNSTIYFCRANHNEFNYSSNPTYLSGSKILVKNNDNQMPPRSYATTVGLYSADNELLAVAKLSEPLRKDPTNELTLRVRLDY
jgi:hypothetical protein